MANYPVRNTENVANLSSIVNEPGHDYHPKAKPVFAHILSKAGWYQVFGKGQCNAQLRSLLNLLLKDIIQLTDITHEEIEQYNEQTGKNEKYSAFFCRDTSGIEYICEKSHKWNDEIYPAGIAFKVNRALTFNVPESFIMENYNPFILFTDLRKEELSRGFGLLNKGKCTCYDSEGHFLHAQALLIAPLSLFHKKADSLRTELDKWLFILKNIDKLKEIPPALDNEYFRPIFEAARFSNLSKDEQEEYLRLHIAF